jgi:hypothetical protein
MNRKSVTVGLGAIALASLLPLVNLLATPVGAKTFPQGQGKRHASFVVVSKLDSAAVDHRTVLEGLIRFDLDNGRVKGGGNYVLFDQGAAGVPKPILSAGKWEAEEFVSFTPCLSAPNCRYGRIESGILELEVVLVPNDGGAEIVATMQVICNVGAGGLLTGQPEGVRLTAAALGGTFSPTIVGPITFGLTHISIPDRE